MRILTISALILAISAAYSQGASKPASIDGWVSVVKPQDQEAYAAILAALRHQKIAGGPPTRNRGRWLYGVVLAKKRLILKELHDKHLDKRVVFSDDPLPGKNSPISSPPNAGKVKATP